MKWPNDLVVGRAKLAGVLAEAEFAAGAPTAAVVGIGLNVAWPVRLMPAGPAWTPAVGKPARSTGGGSSIACCRR